MTVDSVKSSMPDGVHLDRRSDLMAQGLRGRKIEPPTRFY
jgi:hypothetical protein